MPDLQDSPLRERSALDEGIASGRRDQLAPQGEGAWSSTSIGAEGGSAHGAVTARDARQRTSRLRFLAHPSFILGAAGMTVGALALGTLAYRVAHPLPTIALIASLGGIAGAAAGAAITPLLKTLTWGAVTAATLSLGAAALWGVHRIDPLLIRQFFPRW